MLHFLVAAAEPNAADARIDMDRVRELHARVKKGEKLSAEDQAYYDRGAIEWKGGRQQRGQPQAKQPLSAEEELKQATSEVKGTGSEAFTVSEKTCPLETIEIPAAEGHKVLGVLRKPPGPGPFPALVHLHGTLDIKSLESLQAWARDATASRFLAAGYVLITPTFRSRTEDPQTRDALLDCLTMIDYVKKRPDVDPKSVVVWGDSGGGSLALELAGETDLAAIAAQEPATILMTGMLSKENPNTGPLMQDPKKFWTPELQKMTREKIGKIHCPVFIAYGDKSPINLINHEIVIPELKAAGKQVETKLYPGKTHGFSKNSEEFFNDCDKFFRKSLATAPKPINAG